MLTPIAIITLVVAIVALLRVWARFKKSAITFSEGLFWSLLWLTVAFLGVFPEVVHPLALKLDVDTGTDLVFFGAILLLFWLSFRILVRIERIERNITKLVREIALAPNRDEDSGAGLFEKKNNKE